MHLAPARPVAPAFAATVGGLQRQQGFSTCLQSVCGGSRAQRTQMVVSAKKRHGSGGSGGSRSQQTAAKHREQQAAAAAQQSQQQQAAATGVGANAVAPPPPASLTLGGAAFSASQLGGGELDLSRIDKLELRGNELVLTLRNPGDPQPARAEAAGATGEANQGEDFVEVSSPSSPVSAPASRPQCLRALHLQTCPGTWSVGLANLHMDWGGAAPGTVVGAMLLSWAEGVNPVVFSPYGARVACTHVLPCLPACWDGTVRCSGQMTSWTLWSRFTATTRSPTTRCEAPGQSTGPQLAACVHAQMRMPGCQLVCRRRVPLWWPACLLCSAPCLLHDMAAMCVWRSAHAMGAAHRSAADPSCCPLRPFPPCSPWQRKRQYSSTSSGFVVVGDSSGGQAPRYLLTNAHSVEYFTQVGSRRAAARRTCGGSARLRPACRERSPCLCRAHPCRVRMAASTRHAAHCATLVPCSQHLGPLVLPTHP